MDTEVDIPNQNFTLVPGMFAEADFTTESRSKVVTVPITAVDVNAAKDTEGKVLVVGPDGKLESRTVGLGMETADRYEVREGLHEGEAVVIGNRANLRAGEQVRPRVITLGTANQ
jgi:multidrug efflux pump subunit AcrA (membrane-fusion protein)